MVTPSSPTASPRWQVRSVSVRVRDGPRRLQAAYRLLLEPGFGSSTTDGARDAVVPPMESRHADRSVRPRFD